MIGADALGAQPLGDLPTALREGTIEISAYEALLADPDAERRFLVILEPFEPEST